MYTFCIPPHLKNWAPSTTEGSEEDVEGSVEKGQEGVQIHSHVTIVTESTIFYTTGWMAGVAEEARAAQVLRYDQVLSP